MARPTAYGTYTYVIAWSGLLIVAGIGFPTLVLRVLPDYSVREDWGRLRGMLATSLVGTVLLGALIALLGITLVLSLGCHSKRVCPRLGDGLSHGAPSRSAGPSAGNIS